MLWRIVAFLVLNSLILGYASNRSPVRADPVPVDCTQYECKTIHAWWTGAKTYVVAALNEGETANENDAIVDIWTGSSTEKRPQTPITNPKVVLHYMTFPTCTPMCKQPLDGKWQAWMEVTEGGTGSFQSNPNKAACTSGGGNPSNPQSNNNKDGNAPPGN